MEVITISSSEDDPDGFLLSLMLKYLRALGMKEGMILLNERRRKVNPRRGITEEIRMMSLTSRMNLKKRMRLHQGWRQMNPHELEIKGP